MPINLFKLILIFLVSINSFALFEIGGDFSYKRNTFGTNNSSKSTSRTLGGSIAWHLWKYTALEFNHYQTEENTIVNETVSYDDLAISVLGQSTYVNSRNYGVGLRQSFSSRKAFLQPSISLGYAKIFSETTTNYTIRDESNAAVSTSVQPTIKQRYDSMFGTFSLKLRLHKRFSIRGSMQTYINAFDWNGAKNDLRYTVGFTCLL